MGLFGIDRFYKGDILLACIKLAFFYNTFICYFCCFYSIVR
ncbi:hypothetical protein ACUQGS_001682 [Campylobacter coli]